MTSQKAFSTSRNQRSSSLAELDASTAPRRPSIDTRARPTLCQLLPRPTRAEPWPSTRVQAVRARGRRRALAAATCAAGPGCLTGAGAGAGGAVRFCWDGGQDFSGCCGRQNELGRAGARVRRCPVCFERARAERAGGRSWVGWGCGSAVDTHALRNLIGKRKLGSAFRWGGRPRRGRSLAGLRGRSLREVVAETLRRPMLSSFQLVLSKDSNRPDV